MGFWSAWRRAGLARLLNGGSGLAFPTLAAVVEDQEFGLGFPLLFAGDAVVGSRPGVVGHGLGS